MHVREIPPECIFPFNVDFIFGFGWAIELNWLMFVRFIDIVSVGIVLVLAVLLLNKCKHMWLFALALYCVRRVSPLAKLSTNWNKYNSTIQRHTSNKIRKQSCTTPQHYLRSNKVAICEGSTHTHTRWDYCTLLRMFLDNSHTYVAIMNMLNYYSLLNQNHDWFVDRLLFWEKLN